jgi:hypothetical protein
MVVYVQGFLSLVQGIFPRSILMSAKYNEYIICITSFIIVDFVTPLKKRRLARESLSGDSSLAGTLSPSLVHGTSTGFEVASSSAAGEGGGAVVMDLEEIQNRNGFKSCLSPLRTNRFPSTEVSS